MTVFPSIRFFFAALVVTSDFNLDSVAIFTRANSFEKWTFGDPVGSFDEQSNSFTLTFDVDDSIIQANTMASVWDEGCSEGNQLVFADGIENVATAVDTIGEATLSFSLNYQILKQNGNVFTALPALSAAKMKICARFMLFTEDEFIEVNFLETIITISFDFTSDITFPDGENIKLERKERFTPAETYTKSYDVDAYICDPDDPGVPVIGASFSQGTMINVCMTPDAEALSDGIRLKSVDSFVWSKGNIASQDAINGPANVLSSVACAPNSIHCSVTSLLKADFYKTTDAPTSMPTFVGSICNGVSATSETELDFKNSILKQNDLQSGGELRYGNIANISGAPVDLLITSTDYYHPNPDANGKDSSENFGEIGVNTEEGDIESGKGTFDFCFVESNTYTLTMASSFQWTVFDLDNHGSNPEIKEKISIDTSQVAGYSLYPDSILTEIHQYCENDNSAPPCDPNVPTVFEATTVGSGTDNPTDPNDLTEEQKKRSVVFTFTNTSCWTMEFNAYCASEPEQECGWYGGSKLLFSGAAPEVIQQGETDCASDGSNNSEEERNLSFQPPDYVTGSGTVSLTIGRRRLLGADNTGNRHLQAGPRAGVEVNVYLEPADDSYRLRRTAGGFSKRFVFGHLFIVCFNSALLLMRN